MITAELLMAYEKAELPDVSRKLGKEDLPQLVDWLESKHDALRYHALLTLQHRSEYSEDVYPFWDTFASKLKSGNSYQRSIGVMLLADNAKWDTENRFNDTIEPFLSILQDEKPITVRQCIQSLGRIIPYKKHLHDKIARGLMAMHISDYKQTMQKLILTDVLDALIQIRKYKATDEMEEYIAHALSGGVLDPKSAKHIQSLLSN